VSSGTIGDAGSAAKKDPLEWNGGQSGSRKAESAMVDGFCARLPEHGKVNRMLTMVDLRASAQRSKSTPPLAVCA
jgi:hypothetical protein